ncbi:transcriptional regulator, PaaX family protein [Pseudoduganella sp. FT25W]|jgi:phenylacetic acid degradation operon negative regulatory protein|uniref:Transcriptional regulator, PaaX family protein n=1 Tax=Duganella alba TaxID=2666081 RepID=A0A6L5QKD9_9BURK|nr:PaaX family transcriptional regulator C-terminal domain-containing protein [Duganella alba]MRX10150.1 transcriptional regulator, PaaX family protein [Duganella alba]MRX16662.1 transcriptional regulator, PaaX family protein [Duganella alba]
MNSEFYIDAVLRQAKPRLSTLLKLMFSEAQAFGQKTQWLGSVIALLEPLGFQERTIRTALFRLAESKLIKIERHGRRSLCMLTPPTAAAILSARQRLNIPAARSFGEDWTMLVHTGGFSAARYAAARKQLLDLDYCVLAPNVMARPASYTRGIQAGEDHGLALFEVAGAQLAAAVRQPLFGKCDWDLETPTELYEQFQQRFMPLRQMLGQRGAFTDQQAYMVRLLVSHGYQQCRRSDPLLPHELLPADWPAMTSYQTYVALYAGCAAQARRHILKITESPALEQPVIAAPSSRQVVRRSSVYMTA